MTVGLLNAALAFVILVLSVVWYREGHMVKLGLLSMGSRVAIVLMALLMFITSIDKAVGGDTLIPLIAGGFRPVIIVLLGGLILSTWQRRRRP